MLTEHGVSDPDNSLRDINVFFAGNGVQQYAVYLIHQQTVFNSQNRMILRDMNLFQINRKMESAFKTDQTVRKLNRPDPGQLERSSANVRQPLREHNAFKSGFRECEVLNHRNRIRQHHSAQILVFRKCPLADYRDNSAVQFFRHNEIGLGTGVTRDHACAVAVIRSLVIAADERNRLLQRGRRRIHNGRILDPQPFGQLLRNGFGAALNKPQRCAACESSIIHMLQAFGNIYASQILTAFKCARLNLLNAFFKPKKLNRSRRHDSSAVCPAPGG